MFITFEGINGSGKSTQAKLLFEYLKSKGKNVVLTKEPGGGGEFCMELRRLIVQTKNISKLTEMFLLMASRKEHLDKLIKPALAEGKIVICDRYTDSTYAYQCCDDYSKFEFVDKLHKEIGCIVPDITFYIDISVEESEYRLAPLLYESAENTERNGYKKYDELASEHMQKILNTYRRLADEQKERIYTIDGTANIEAIQREIIEKLGL